MAENCIANGTISLIVPNLETLNGAVGKPRRIASTIQTIGGLAWQLKIHKVLEPAKLRLSIKCNEDVKDHLWLCKAYVKLRTGHLDGTGRLTQSTFFPTFNLSTFILELTDDHYQAIFDQLKTSPVEFKLYIRIQTMTNFPPLNTTLVVNMGQRKSKALLVNKHLLAGMSSYFSNLFFGDCCDKELDINLFQLNETDDFDIQAFKWMLYGAMTMDWEAQVMNFFNSNALVRIIRLGVKFDMALMFVYWEKSLMDSEKMSMTKYSKMELLELADHFSLVQLREHCLNEIGVLDYTEDFTKNTEIHAHLSNATKERLQKKLDGKAHGQGNLGPEGEHNWSTRCRNGVTIN